MLRTTRHRSTWRAFGLAFAIVLAPALMQTEDLSCHSVGIATLETLTVEVDGRDMIEGLFTPNRCMYEVELPASYEAIVIGAQATDPEATISYNWTDGCSLIECSECDDFSDGQVTLDATSTEALTMLKVWVHAPGPMGKRQDYTVVFVQPALCI